MTTFLKYHYNGKVKKVVFKEDLLKIDVLTRSIKDAYKSHKECLLLYYLDQDQQKIVLLSDQDVSTMTKAIRPTNSYYSIFVAKREAALEENIENNIQILIRYYIGKIKSKFNSVESLRTSEYKEAMKNISAHMNRRKISVYLSEQIVNGIKYQMKTELIEGQLDDIMRKIESQESSMRLKVIKPLNTSVSTIRSVKVSEESKLISIDQNTTFLSPSDASHFNMTVGDILGPRGKHDFYYEDTIDKSGQIIIEEKGNNRFYCGLCNSEINGRYFECTACNDLVLCMKCEDHGTDKHMLVRKIDDRSIYCNSEA